MIFFFKEVQNNPITNSDMFCFIVKMEIIISHKELYNKAELNPQSQPDQREG